MISQGPMLLKSINRQLKHMELPEKKRTKRSLEGMHVQNMPFRLQIIVAGFKSAFWSLGVTNLFSDLILRSIIFSTHLFVNVI